MPAVADALRDDDPGGNRWAPEQRVTVGAVGNATITGRSDLYDRISATVVDWKIVGPTTLRDAKANGPKPGYRTQGHLYGLGFTNADLPVDMVMIAFRRAVEKAGAPVGTTLHDLRHYYASLLIRHGESVKVVQARLGHASATETLNVYSHLWPDSDDRTRAAVDDVLGASALTRNAGTVLR